MKGGIGGFTGGKGGFGHMPNPVAPFMMPFASPLMMGANIFRSGKGGLGGGGIVPPTFSHPPEPQIKPLPWATGRMPPFPMHIKPTMGHPLGSVGHHMGQAQNQAPPLKRKIMNAGGTVATPTYSHPPKPQSKALPPKAIGGIQKAIGNIQHNFHMPHHFAVPKHSWGSMPSMIASKFPTLRR